MPWRLILFVVFLVLVTVFIGFNLDNVCAISVGLYTFTDVPVFMALIGAFAVGILIMIPFVIVSRKNGHKKLEKGKKSVGNNTGITANSSGLEQNESKL